MLSLCPFDISVGVGAFVIGLGQISSFLSWSCAKLCEAFTFLMENIFVQFDGMAYQQIVGIPMGTNCAPLIADLFLYCYERDFMSDLPKSKRHDLVDMSNDTSRYLDDIPYIGLFWRRKILADLLQNRYGKFWRFLNWRISTLRAKIIMHQI